MFLRSEELVQRVFAAELFTPITNFLKFPTNAKVSNGETVKSSPSTHALPVQRLNITLEGRRQFLGAFRIDHQNVLANDLCQPIHAIMIVFRLLSDPSVNDICN